MVKNQVSTLYRFMAMSSRNAPCFDMSRFPAINCQVKMKRQRDDDRDTRGTSPAEGSHSKRSRPAYNQERGHQQRIPQEPRRSDAGGANNGNTVQVRTLKDAREEDEHRLAQRQKQIDYGKNTLGYDRYCAMVPRHTRRRGEHPMTPDKTLKVGKKQFDGMIRKWRQALHDYDPPELKKQLEAAEQRQKAESAATETAASEVTMDDADLDPELAELDPKNHQVGPSIFDGFHEDEATGQQDLGEDDEDDDLL